jgi:hypothetical protein
VYDAFSFPMPSNQPKSFPMPHNASSFRMQYSLPRECDTPPTHTHPTFAAIPAEELSYAI